MNKRTILHACGVFSTAFFLSAAAVAQDGSYGRGHIPIGEPNPHYLCPWMIAPPQNYFPTRGACMSAYLADR